MTVPFIIARTDGVDGTPTEYFCCACKQLRLSLNKNKSCCGNCRSEHIITGKVGTLNKPELLRLYKS